MIPKFEGQEEQANNPQLHASRPLSVTTSFREELRHTLNDLTYYINPHRLIYVHV